MTMRLGTQTGSLINSVMSSAKAIEPQLGMGVTSLGWTDRYAGTVVEVTSNGFVMQEDKAIRTDTNGMSDSQAYRYEQNPDGRMTEYRRVTRGKAKGTWKERGQTAGGRVLIGFRQAYYDYSF